MSIDRRIDNLGRVVIPKEIRDKLDIKQKDALEIYNHGSNIILKKFETSCIFCGNEKTLINYKNKLICEKCIKKLKNI